MNDGGGDRRQELTQGATTYVLTHGLIGLSLRPLAAALGTSDRMLLYHFADKHELVAEVLRCVNDRSIAELGGVEPAGTVREAVIRLWAACSSGQLEACQRLYVEAAALGLLGREPYAGLLRKANERWLHALTQRLVASSCPAPQAPRVAYLLDAAFMGFQLDSTLYRGTPDHTRAVADLADALAALAGDPPA